MAHLNIVSVPKNIDELRILLDNQPLDILALNETRLDPTISSNEMNINGYELIRFDRSRNGGGACMYLRTTLNYTNRNDIVPNDLEAVCAEIHKPNSKPFVVTTIYRAPSSSSEYFDKLEKLIENIDSEDKELYVLGDLNCNWLQPTNSNTRRLSSFCDVYQLSQLIKQPTRITDTCSSLLDVIITNDPERIVESGVSHLGISDHSLVYAIRKINGARKRPPKIIYSRNFRSFNTNNFLNDLICQHWSHIQTLENPDQMWSAWKCMFLSVVDKHAPFKTKRVRSKNLPWLTKEIKELMLERDKMKRKFVFTKNQEFWNAYKKLRNQVNNALKNTKCKYYKNELNDQKDDPRATWKTINSLMGRHSNKQVINELKINNNKISLPAELAESFNNYFVEIGPKLAADIDGNSEMNFRHYIPGTSSKFDFSFTNESKVLRIIKKLSSFKATGLDGISAKILKVAGPVVSQSLTFLFNAIIASGTFPMEWKKARVSPLFKAGTRNALENYRPISVLPVISKVFERILYNQLYAYLSSNNLLTNKQFGFRKLHSTMTALLNSTNSWLLNMDRGLFNIVVFIDLKKAFDTVDHEILIQKLNMYGVDNASLRLMQSYLSDRYQSCAIQNSRSKERLITCGVPQGSILGPLLFLLYINDLPNCLETSTPSLFADDTNITISGINRVDVESRANRELARINDWLIANKLHLNVAKTEFMLVGTRQRLSNLDETPDLKIGAKQLNRVNHSKTLGVVVDENLTWNDHIDHITKKIVSGLGAIKRIRPFVSHDILITIYHAIVQSHLDYCCEVWDSIGKGLSGKLQKFQNRAGRLILGTDYRTRSNLILDVLGWKSLKERRVERKAIFMHKIIQNIAPASLTELFTKVSDSTKYNLRGSSTKLTIPRPNTESLKKSISYNGAKVWNELPESIRQIESLTSFRNKIREITLLNA